MCGRPQQQREEDRHTVDSLHSFCAAWAWLPTSSRLCFARASKQKRIADWTRRSPAHSRAARRANVIAARSLCSHTTHQQARRRAGKSLTPGTPRSGFAICRSAFGCIVVHPSCTPAAYGNLAARRSSSVSSHARLLIASKSLPIPRFWAAASVEVAAHSFLSAIVSSRIWWRHWLSLLPYNTCSRPGRQLARKL